MVATLSKVIAVLVSALARLEPRMVVERVPWWCVRWSCEKTMVEGRLS
jgi:hypothetical protein